MSKHNMNNKRNGNQSKKPYVDEPKNRSKSWEDRESRDMRRDEKARRNTYFATRMRGDEKNPVINSSGVSTHNDVSWYTGNGDLAKDLGNLNFNYQLGLPTSQGNLQLYNGTSSITYVNSMNVIPGVMTIDFAPTYGPLYNANAAVNYAAQKNYTAIRYKNSGGANYDPVDLQMYYLAMDSCYMYLAWLTRLYRVANLYSPYNRYYPFAILEAMGIKNPKLIISNLARFRSVINSLVPMYNSLKVPDNMPIFKRHAWMCSNVYMDANISRGQTYIYNPKFVYVYSETEGTLTPYDFITDLNSVTEATADAIYDKMYDIGLNIFQPIFTSQSIGNMSGDVEKAFDTGVVSLVTVTPDEKLTPVCDPEVLMQIHNLNTLTTVNNDVSDFLITLNRTTNSLTQPVKFMLNTTWSLLPNSGTPFKLMMDIRNDQPSIDDVIVASRLMAYPTLYSSATPTSSIRNATFGSEVVLDWKIWDLNTDGTAAGAGTLMYSFPIATTSAGVIASQWASVSKFDWAPRQYGIIGGSSSANGSLYFNGDIDNYSFIGYEYLDQMHKMAMLSLMGVTDK